MNDETGGGALVPCDVGSRIGRLIEDFDTAHCDALVVTNLQNVRYLTGFTGSSATAVVTAAGSVLITDGRYATQAPAEIEASGAPVAVEVVSESERAASTPRSALVAAIRRAGTTGASVRVGLEAGSVTWARQQRFEKWLTEDQVDFTLVPTTGVVETIRAVKDAGEVSRIEFAASLADAAFAEVRPRLADGPTEAEFGFELDMCMRRLGATERSFETIVASGPNSALPHARPGRRIIGPGDLVVVDFGAMVDGYRSDMTRTMMVGEPTAEQQRMLTVVAEAQAAGAAAVGPGVSCADVDRACRCVIAAAGWGDLFVHGTGHGVGLDIHESPWVNSTSAATLAPGHVVTVEPGVYLPEVGGVRVEDTLLVTTAGARPLTLAPKQPILV